LVAERREAELADRGFEDEYSSLKRGDGAGVQAVLKQELVDSVVERGDVSARHGGESPAPPLIGSVKALVAPMFLMRSDRAKKRGRMY
jgi:hypothetical protein